MTTLPDYAHAAAHRGVRIYAWYVLLVYGDYQKWTDETRRARWDGAASLLNWWHEQDTITRPPLDNLNADDVRDYMGWLESARLGPLNNAGLPLWGSGVDESITGGAFFTPSV